MPIGTTAKTFFKNLAIGAATEIIRGWLNEKLKNIEPSDLYEYITKGNDLWSDIPPSIKDSARKFKKKYGELFDKFQDNITTQLILQWMKEDWPQLFSTIINTPNGLMWLDGQVRRIKQQIIEM